MEPMSTFTDNQAAIRKVEIEESMSSAKHLDVRLKYICDVAKRDIVRPEYLESRLMMADILTKAPRTAELRELFSLR